MKIKPPLQPVRVRTLVGRRLSSVLRLNERLIPGLHCKGQSCPGCGIWEGDFAGLSELIIHLNDQHEWTLLEIADWLDTLDLDLTVHVPTKPIKGAAVRGPTPPGFLKGGD